MVPRSMAATMASYGHASTGSEGSTLTLRKLTLIAARPFEAGRRQGSHKPRRRLPSCASVDRAAGNSSAAGLLVHRAALERTIAPPGRSALSRPSLNDLGNSPP